MHCFLRKVCDLGCGVDIACRQRLSQSRWHNEGPSDTITKKGRTEIGWDEIGRCGYLEYLNPVPSSIWT